MQAPNLETLRFPKIRRLDYYHHRDFLLHHRHCPILKTPRKKNRWLETLDAALSWLFSEKLDKACEDPILPKFLLIQTECNVRYLSLKIHKHLTQVLFYTKEAKFWSRRHDFNSFPPECLLAR